MTEKRSEAPKKFKMERRDAVVWEKFSKFVRGSTRPLSHSMDLSFTCRTNLMSGSTMMEMQSNHTDFRGFQRSLQMSQL